MYKFFGKYPVKLADRLSVDTPLCIRVPEFTLAVPALQLQITMVIEPVHHLRRRL
jgi:hypothetical protein